MMDQPDLNEIYGKYVCWWASMMNLITLNGLDLAARMIAAILINYINVGQNNNPRSSNLSEGTSIWGC
jgi:hypothetical protein